MSIIHLNEIKDKFFIEHFYYDLKTGRIYKNLDVCFPINVNNIIEIPNYSMAYVRQQFLINISQEKELDMTEYELNTYPEFSLYSTPETRKIEFEYISANHCFCEDNQLEGQFWDFYDELTFQFARQWCEENGIPYMEND